jgi:hypothetical protein
VVLPVLGESEGDPCAQGLVGVQGDSFEAN